ncbi:hypothetical protein BGZ99_009577 [Dissophora globulifera]|uniref:Uncharacterized protein n=1 Tax=Dissophora globulifera TaxID=979702 RepID=A0A9P6R8I4_9FUNG|nr:hypothetical protein BGZ99_009577 [Dissophora globulifera]
MEKQFQILFTQNYELHEYPIPRHFIILPKESHWQDFARNLVSKTFRLHFLCEGDAHTGCEAEESSHKIHLANHEGYDIEKLPAFVQKYRSHLLTMLQIVKHSLIVAEFAVPALQHFKLVHNLEMAASHLTSTRKAFGALVNESISFVKDHPGNNDNIISVPTHPVDLRRSPGINGFLLRQLESFLSLNDRDRVLGNLYRIPTKTGHIKWVCRDYYNRNFPKPPAVIRRLSQLHTFTTDNGGAFVEEKGMVKVELDSESRADEFYDLIEGLECIIELRITLEWTVTTHNLQNLCEVIANSNIVQLELSGCGKAEATSGIDSSLFRPLLDLMLNGKIQIMVLQKVYHRDFLYVNGSGVSVTSKLRELTFTDLSTVDDGVIPTLPGIVGFCLSLTTLSVKSEFAHDVLSQILRDPLRFIHLKTLVMHETGKCHYHLVVRLSRGKIRSIEVMRLSSGSWEADGLYRLLSGGHITKLGVLLDGVEAHGNQCIEILRYNPKVLEFHLFIPELCASAVYWVITSMHEFHAKQQSIPQYQIKIHCDTHPEVVSCALDFNEDSRTFSISTHIQLIPQVYNMDNLIELVLEFGWSVTRLDFRSYFNRKLALALASSVMDGNTSHLECLLLDPARLISKDDFDCIDRILRQSKHLTNFSAVLRMDDNNWKAGAIWLFGAYREILTGLMLEGAKGVIWNGEMAKLFPSRSELKNLEALSLKRVDTAMDVKLFAKWVTGMISNPSPCRTWSKPFTRGESPSSSSNSSDRTHLKLIELESITLDEDRWETIFESMDYTGLEKLTLIDNKLSSKQLELLMECIAKFADDDTELPLEELNIGGYVDDWQWYLLEENLMSLTKRAPKQLQQLPEDMRPQLQQFHPSIYGLMDKTKISDPSIQLFQAHTPGDISTVSKARSIHTRFDSSGGQHFVLWKDIQNVFPHAKYVLDSDNIVNFIRDEDLNDGLSISLHNFDKNEHSPASKSKQGLVSTLEADFAKPEQHLNLIKPSASKLYAEGSAEYNTFSMEPSTSNIHVVPNRELERDGGGGKQQDDTEENIHVDELLDETNQGGIPQEVDHIKQLIHLEQLQTSAILEHLRKEYKELELELQAMEEHRFNSERRALLNVADMQRRIITILDRTYELQDDPRPTLFIVLPSRSTTSNIRDRDPSPKFRLYFLCECSDVANSEDDTNSEDDFDSEDDVFSQGIHLVKHEGYDVKNSDEFFQKYGRYVLTMLQMVKYGFVATGVTVPALAHFKQIEGIDAIQQTLDISQMTIGSLIDDTIAFIEDQADNMIDGINMLAGSLGFYSYEVLEGADLRQLQSYLEVNDSNRVLGNLCRIVNSEGHVKWVCRDHCSDPAVNETMVLQLKLHVDPIKEAIPQNPATTSNVSEVDSYHAEQEIYRLHKPIDSKRVVLRDLKTSGDDDFGKYPRPLVSIKKTTPSVTDLGDVPIYSAEYFSTLHVKDKKDEMMDLLDAFLALQHTLPELQLEAVKSNSAEEADAKTEAKSEVQLQGQVQLQDQDQVKPSNLTEIKRSKEPLVREEGEKPPSDPESVIEQKPEISRCPLTTNCLGDGDKVEHVKDDNLIPDVQHIAQEDNQNSGLVTEEEVSNATLNDPTACCTQLKEPTKKDSLAGIDVGKEEEEGEEEVEEEVGEEETTYCDVIVLRRR